MRLFVLVTALILTACSQQGPKSVPLYPNETPDLRQLIEAAAVENDVPVALVQRVVIRESAHRPGARNGPYYGLMQILPATARLRESCSTCMMIPRKPAICGTIRITPRQKSHCCNGFSTGRLTTKCASWVVGAERGFVLLS